VPNPISLQVKYPLFLPEEIMQEISSNKYLEFVSFFFKKNVVWSNQWSRTTDNFTNQNGKKNRSEERLMCKGNM
jgi:hypothetical protein